jgi:hypothetical protein
MAGPEGIIFDHLRRVILGNPDHQEHPIFGTVFEPKVDELEKALLLMES